jgi:hypothetical protein
LNCELGLGLVGFYIRIPTHVSLVHPKSPSKDMPPASRSHNLRLCLLNNTFPFAAFPQASYYNHDRHRTQDHRHDCREQGCREQGCREQGCREPKTDETKELTESPLPSLRTRRRAPRLHYSNLPLRMPSHLRLLWRRHQRTLSRWVRSTRLSSE